MGTGSMKMDPDISVFLQYFDSVKAEMDLNGIGCKW